MKAVEQAITMCCRPKLDGVFSQSLFRGEREREESDKCATETGYLYKSELPTYTYSVYWRTEYSR